MHTATANPNQNNLWQMEKDAKEQWYVFILLKEFIGLTPQHIREHSKEIYSAQMDFS